ncbi:hypothetical protein [Limnoglobus roseus]|uniref:Lipoprotein n=1 Tax=Limnoglobus roseus TaxID=2598579 RepID=A0A5C1AM61_9BACT|nr:hypothetical protein [Limnoglobus roseus]QEL20499.1 hypothetical protein PX52LOC_07603 [Limnoglobus roseus]
MRRLTLAVSLLVIALTCGCGSTEPHAVAEVAVAPDRTLVRVMVDLYAANPAKAYAAYRDRPQPVTGIVPRKIEQLPEFRTVYKVACDLDGKRPEKDPAFYVYCTEREAAGWAVGTAGSAVLMLRQSDRNDVRPVFITPAGAVAMGEESRSRQRGN